MRLLATILIISLFLIGCTSESIESKTPFTQIDIATGLRLFDENGSPIGLWQVPNDKIGSTKLYQLHIKVTNINSFVIT